jgi:flagellar assembly protein FliH
VQGIQASPTAAPQIQPHPAPAVLWTVEAFEYRSYEPGPDKQDEALSSEPRIRPWHLGAEYSAAASTAQDGESSTADEPQPSLDAVEALLSEARRQGHESGRKQGREEGRLEAEEQAHAELAAHAQTAEQQRQTDLAHLVEDFDAARERYFHAIEPETVRLALAVAARIIRREAQMDPLLLTGAVRVALGQIASSSKVRLKVPPADLNLWKEAIAHLPKLSVRPDVIPGEAMRLGDCIIETELGSVDLGVRSQLSEIERGFFDRAGTPITDPNATPDSPSEPRA